MGTDRDKSSDPLNGDKVTRLLTPAEASRMLNVHPKTLSRWANGGMIASVVTPGGHHRYPIDSLLRLKQVQSEPSDPGEGAEPSAPTTMFG